MKPPAFQFYAKDWLADTAHLTPAQEGCYIRLLAHQWVEGPLSDSPRGLARRLRVSQPEFRALWKALARYFPVNGHGTIANPRLEEVRSAQIAKSIARSLAGAKGAAVAHGKARDLP